VSPRATLVVNPTAGKGRAETKLGEVAATLSAGGWDVEVRRSRTFAEAESIVADTVAHGVDALVVMGGDGMMHLGLNHAAKARAGGDHRTTLGLVPAGTGNDLCRGLGLDPDDAVAAARAIVAGKVTEIDLARVNDRYVGAVLATGFDALVNQRANALPWPRGQARYVVATMAELRVFTPLSYRLEVDGRVRELSAMLVAVGNTPSYGGGMRICPDASPTDGQLDITIIHPVSRFKLLQLLPQMFSGRFARDPCVEQLRATTVRVEGARVIGYGDGERLDPTPLQVQVAPRALAIFAPHPSPGAGLGPAR
jgi:diacylglycerol kinase (ATP)